MTSNQDPSYKQGGDHPTSRSLRRAEELCQQQPFSSYITVDQENRMSKLFGLSANEDQRAEWLSLVFGGNLPQAKPKQLLVYDCFTNLG